MVTTKLPHLSDDHRFAIANVTARVAQMETQIEKTIVTALRSQPKTAEFLLKNFSMERIVGLLKALLLDAAPEEAPQIENLIKTIADLRSERNDFLHTFWTKGFADDTAIAASSRPFREFRFSELSAEQVQKTADEMRDVVHALLRWQEFLRKLPEQPSA